MIAVSVPCKRLTNALQTVKYSVVAPWDRGSSVLSQWGHNGINDIRCRHSAHGIDAPSGCGGDAVTSPYSPCGLHANAIAYSGVLVAIICVPTGCTWHPRRALGDPTALLLLRSHRVLMALIQIAMGTPSYGTHFVHAQSVRRGMASYETPRRWVEMPRRWHGDPSAL